MAFVRRRRVNVRDVVFVEMNLVKVWGFLIAAGQQAAHFWSGSGAKPRYNKQRLARYEIASQRAMAFLVE